MADRVHAKRPRSLDQFLEFGIDPHSLVHNTTHDLDLLFGIV
jgi:hypothetical protein